MNYHLPPGPKPLDEPEPVICVPPETLPPSVTAYGQSARICVPPETVVPEYAVELSFEEMPGLPDAALKLTTALPDASLKV